MTKPSYYYESVENIGIQDLKSLGISYCLIDLDNTLLVYTVETLEDFGLAFINVLKENNIEPIIISNNHKKRVEKALKDLDIKYLHDALKPFKKRTVKFLNEHLLDVKDGLFIGDQLHSDIKLANKLNMRSILVEPLVRKDLLITKINRLRDRHLRKKLYKKGLLKPINGKDL